MIWAAYCCCVRPCRTINFARFNEYLRFSFSLEYLDYLKQRLVLTFHFKLKWIGAAESHVGNSGLSSYPLTKVAHIEKQLQGADTQSAVIASVAIDLGRFGNQYSRGAMRCLQE